MKRGPRPKPTVLHQLHGTIRTPHRQRGPEPVAPGEIDLAPPPDLDPLAAEAWVFAVEHAPRGVLRRVDRAVLRAYAIAESLMVEAHRQQAKLSARGGLPLLVKSAKGDLILSPFAKLQLRLLPALIRSAAELGFSPSSRAGMSSGDDGAADDDWRWLELEAIRKKPANTAA